MSAGRSALIAGLALCVCAQSAPLGDIIRVRLGADTTIGGIRCAKTNRAYAEIYPSGALRSCPLPRDTTVSGYPLNARTWIVLDTVGVLRFAWLNGDWRLSGHECRGAGYKGYVVHFRRTGELELCYLARHEDLNGIPCVKGTFWTELWGGGKSAVAFHRDGSLAECQLLRDVTWRGTRFQKWDRVARDADGTLRTTHRTQPLEQQP